MKKYLKNGMYLILLSSTVATLSAYAELIDSSPKALKNSTDPSSNNASDNNSEQLAIDNVDNATIDNAQAAWLVQPNFRLSRHQSRRIAKNVYPPECGCIETAAHLAECRRFKKLQLQLRLLIDEQGDVIESTIEKSSGYSQLDRYSMVKAKMGKFKPFYRQGSPHKVIVNLPINYLIEPTPAKICTSE